MTPTPEPLLDLIIAHARWCQAPTTRRFERFGDTALRLQEEAGSFERLHDLVNVHISSFPWRHVSLAVADAVRRRNQLSTFSMPCQSPLQKASLSQV